VSHDLSNAIVYGGLHYGARWLPTAVLNGINLVGNTLAIALLRETQRGIRENFQVALGASPRGRGIIGIALRVSGHDRYLAPAKPDVRS
jgi:hypothetical protein